MSQAWNTIQTNTKNDTKSHRQLDFHLATKPTTSFQMNVTITSSQGNKQQKKENLAKKDNNKNVPSIPVEYFTPLPGLFDPNNLNDILRWNAISKVGPGLQNYGNTCYLNSTLQCLLHLPVFSQLLTQSNFYKLSQLQVNEKSLQSMVLLQYQQLVQEVWKNPKRDSSKSIAPRQMAMNIRKVGKQLRPGRQEDAHEYLVQLLDCIHEEVLKHNNVKLSDGRIAETTFISRIFGGYFCNEISCPNCKHISKTYNYYQSLSLDIPSGVSSVDAAIKNFVKPETLTAGNEYRCEKCNQKVRATKQLQLASTPEVLNIHLKRFSFLSANGKINKQISFEQTIEVPTQSKTYEINNNKKKDTTVKYDLAGIVVHHGSSVHSGHYVAFVKAPNGQWFEMNDSHVSVRPIQQVLSQQAYVLFYTKRPDPSKTTPSKPVPIPTTPTAPKAEQPTEVKKTEPAVNGEVKPVTTKQTKEKTEKAVEAPKISESPIVSTESDKSSKKKEVVVKEGLTPVPDLDMDMEPVPFCRLREIPGWKTRAMRWEGRVNKLRAFMVNDGPFGSRRLPLRLSEYPFFDTDDMDAGMGSDMESESEEEVQPKKPAKRSIEIENITESKKQKIEETEATPEATPTEEEKPAVTKLVWHQKPVNHSNSSNSATNIKHLLTQQSKLGVTPGSIGTWDADDDDDLQKTLSAAKSIVNKQVYAEQDFLASRQISEWDKVLDQGRVKKVKVKYEDAPTNGKNAFQEAYNRRQSDKRSN